MYGLSLTVFELFSWLQKRYCLPLVWPGYDDTYCSRSYCFIERQKMYHDTWYFLTYQTMYHACLTDSPNSGPESSRDACQFYQSSPLSLVLNPNHCTVPVCFIYSSLLVQCIVLSWALNWWASASIHDIRLGHRDIIDPPLSSRMMISRSAFIYSVWLSSS